MKQPSINDTVILYDPVKNVRHFVHLEKDKTINTDKGKIDSTLITRKGYGNFIETHLGYRYVILPFNLHDFIMYRLERKTQIVYPKDAGYIVIRLGVKPGNTVLECGTGSGAMTCIFSYITGENGRVITYEREKKFIELAKKNLAEAGLGNNVVFKNKDASEGFDEREVDAAFLDVREPWLYIKSAWESLKPGNCLCTVVPTANQIIETLKALKPNFTDIQICEILKRDYKTNPERLRPQDRMPAHTAYLISGRKIMETADEC